MKKFLLSCFGVFCAMLVFAQGPTPIGPNKISFQAVVRDSANKLVSNVDNINVGIEVIDEANYDKVYYAENHFPVESNVNGLISLLVGTGDVLSGSFDSIPWQNVCFRTTITVPDNRPVVGISPIAAVPYALYASNVDSLIKRIDSLERRVNDSIVNGEIGPKLECEIHLCTKGLTVTILESPIGKVDWGDGNWSAATGYDVSHTYDTTGIYTLHLYSQGVCSATKTVNLNIPPCTGTKKENEVGEDGKITAVKDEQGHVYHVVQIGSQCWMAENVRKTLDPIPGVPHKSNLAGANRSVFLNDDLVSPYYPKSFIINPEDSSVLYNWTAAIDAKGIIEHHTNRPASAADFVQSPGIFGMFLGLAHMVAQQGVNIDDLNDHSGKNFRGICPKGWHLPAFSEFQTLYNYTGCSPMDGMGDLYGYGKLAGGCSWKSCDSYHLESESMTTGSACAEAPGNYDYAERNSTFFSALPYTTSLTITNDRSTDLLAPFSNLGGNVVRSVITLLRELGVGKNDNDYSEACALISIDDAYDKTHFWTRDEHIDQCCFSNNCGGELGSVTPNFGSNWELKYIMSYFARTATVMSNGYIEGANNYRSQAEMHAVRCVRNAE